MDINEILSVISAKTGSQIKKSGQGYVACCPAHEDKNPSLSISESSDGKVLMNCFAGCSINDICSSIGIKISDLSPDTFEQKEQKPKRKVIEYLYRDEVGKVIFEKVRVEPARDGKPKAFFFKRKDEKGKEVLDNKGCRKLLYKLPEVLKGIADNKPIFLVEGEKDVDTLSFNGLVATTTTTSLHWEEEFTNILKEAQVIVLYDYDKTGFNRRDLLRKKLFGRVKSLRVVDLPGLEYKEEHGEDISDWLQRGNTIQDLEVLVSKSVDLCNNKVKREIRVVSVEEFLNIELPKREMLLFPFLPSQGLVLLYAKRGVGKTHVALGISYAVASGGNFFRWFASACKKVLYIDGEMPAVLMQERLRRLCSMKDSKQLPKDFLNFITPDLQENFMPDLSTEEGRNSIREHILGHDLIVVDNISTLFNCGAENEAESWIPVQNWALDLRRMGKSVLFVHHAGKGGGQRGTSKKEDVLDAVIKLEHSVDYKYEEGAKFEVHFEKTRNFYGEDAIPFQVHLKRDSDGVSVWEISDVQVDLDIFDVARRKKEGKTIAQISQEMGLTKSQVETRNKKAKQMGLLDEGM